MKLYNLFEQVILEANGNLITEGVSVSDVEAAIDGKYNVWISYSDNDSLTPTKRYIQVYNLSHTKGGNPAIRAFQISGGSTREQSNGYWKIFRLDRISEWKPTNMKWYKPVSDNNPGIPKYNRTGDKTMSVVNKMVDPTTFNN
jgi:predicted DNA-binding transcriptional regulator YafY